MRRSGRSEARVSCRIGRLNHGSISRCGGHTHSTSRTIRRGRFAQPRFPAGRKFSSASLVTSGRRTCGFANAVWNNLRIVAKPAIRAAGDDSLSRSSNTEASADPWRASELPPRRRDGHTNSSVQDIAMAFGEFGKIHTALR